MATVWCLLHLAAQVGQTLQLGSCSFVCLSVWQQLAAFCLGVLELGLARNMSQL